jgi:hypothetical protein
MGGLKRDTLRLVAVLLVGASQGAIGEVATYEGDSFPDEDGWDAIQVFCDPDLLIETGGFRATVELCDPYPPPGGKEATYRVHQPSMDNSVRFFAEWRFESTAEATELPWGGGGNLGLGDDGAANYTFAFGLDEGNMNRGNIFGLSTVNYEAGVPHVFRLEHYEAEQYIWYVDGEVVDSGVPEAFFPDTDFRIVWRTKAAWLPNTTWWDYIRFGDIPTDASGDFDSDGHIDLRDWRYFVECVERTGITPDDPGCRWADMDADGDVDLADFATFQALFGD